MNNSVYGKSMENLRKRANVSKPSFVSQKMFSGNFVAIYDAQPVLTLNKPIYVEFSISNKQIFDA